jgi:DNA-binding NarL/FixJ family response regulator
VRARLRDGRVTRIPRGPQEATRDSPAGLTGRQAQVALLLAEGLSNAQIARRLVVRSRRTSVTIQGSGQTVHIGRCPSAS